MYEVTVNQRDQSCGFKFDKSSDALNFVETCLECSEEGTVITIEESEDE